MKSGNNFSDAEGTDAEGTDAERTDVERTDAERTDVERTFALMEFYGAGLEDIVRRPEETKKAALFRLDER